MNLNDLKPTRGENFGEPSARLASGRDPLSRGLQRFVRATDVADGEAAAWMRVRHRGRPPARSHKRWFVWLGIAAVGAAALLLLVRRPPLKDRSRVSLQPAPLIDQGITAIPAPRPVVRRWRSTARPRGLPVGAWDLDHARIHVSEDAQATAQVAPRGERIRVTRGRVDVDVAPGASGRIEVVAGAYTFVDVGTRFSVDKQPATTFLTVTEGVVDVRWNHRRVATLSGPQGFWRSPSPRQVTPARPRLIRAATAAAVPPSCSSLLTGNDAAMAIRCLDQRSMGDGVGAEAALYEMGRLRRDRLGDLSGALQAFEEGRRRFPDGALSVEVQLSIVDLLPRLGRYQESLDESASLVAQASTVERTAELRLLRGNVYREGLNDCGRALIEYRALAGAKGRVGDDGLFFEAVCLEQMARRSDAVSAYQRYLARADARRRDQAERRLQALLP